MSKKVLLTILLCLCSLIAINGAEKKFTLVIDAGHGGHDIGAPGKRTNEKTINLKVALAFGGYVERNCPDVKVIYTRKTDKFLPLYARAKVANKNKADLFISIHTNALPKGRIARGLETFTLGMHRADDNLDVAKRENDVILLESDYKQRYEGFDPNSSESYIIFEFMQDKNMEQSVELARLIQRRTCASAGRINKGVKQAGFLVLRETSMPSCLVELGFITTPDEERFLSTKQGVDALGIGLYKAFVDYKKKYYGGNYAPMITEISQEAEESMAAIEEPTHENTVETPVKKPVANAKPVFKVQILASNKRIPTGDRRFKGLKNISSYTEKDMYKYTVGSSEDYDEINRLRRSLSKKFPQAFVIAFKHGQRTDIKTAINEFKTSRNKR